MNDPHRGTGRTTRMLEEAKRVAETGQRVFVVMATRREGDDLRSSQIWRDLDRLGAKFISKDSEMRGLDGVFFCDHHAQDTMTKEEYERYIIVASRRAA